MTTEQAVEYALGKIDDRELALLAVAADQLEEALECFERALTRYRETGARRELGLVCLDFAAALLTRGDAGDREKARALLDEGLAVAQTLSMSSLKKRIEDRLQRLPDLPPESKTYPSGLTEREVEVLRLTAQGLTNKEIADRLFISFKTVGTHLSNIFEKTGAVNRTEASAYAIRQDLT